MNPSIQDRLDSVCAGASEKTCISFFSWGLLYVDVNYVPNMSRDVVECAHVAAPSWPGGWSKSGPDRRGSDLGIDPDP